jgi:hypothetical protein
MLAGVGIGLFDGLGAAAAAMSAPDRRFLPHHDAGARAARRDNWHRAVDQVLAGVEA